MKSSSYVQDHYPDDFSHCYGCGRLNPEGHQLKSEWDGDEMVARFSPRPEHLSAVGFVYGGLIASIVDCHAMATAAAAAERREGRAVGERDAPRYVTAALHVDFLAPTPLGPELEARATVREWGARKAVVDVTVSAGSTVTARGHVVAVPIPERMKSAV